MYSQVCNLSFVLLIPCFGAAALTSALSFCKTKCYIFTETAWFQMFQLPSCSAWIPWRILKFSGGENTELPSHLSPDSPEPQSPHWSSNISSVCCRNLVTSKYIYSYNYLIHPSCSSIQLNGFPILLRCFCSYMWHAIPALLLEMKFEL